MCNWNAPESQEPSGVSVVIHEGHTGSGLGPGLLLGENSVIIKRITSVLKLFL